MLDLRPARPSSRRWVGAGLDVWLLDWGVPEAEDRYLDWDVVVQRLDRAARRVLRETARPSRAVLGYCMGGTLAAIDAAQQPD